MNSNFPTHTNSKREILDFITRRFGNTDANWQTGNCYWFAKILTDRFPDLQIYYDPIVGHFAAGYRAISGALTLFDSTGEIKTAKKCYVSLAGIRDDDPLWYERLKQYCID